MVLPSLLASLLSVAPPESPELALTWHAPPNCGSRDDAIAELRELLPDVRVHEREPSPGEGLDVEIAIAGQPEQRYVAALRFRGPRGLDERTIAGPSCTTVASAALLIVAVTLDPIATVEQLDVRLAAPEPEPPEPALPEPALPELPEPPVPALPEPPEPGEIGEVVHLDAPAEARAPIRLRAALGLLGGGGWGPIRAGMGTLGVELGLLAPWWRVGVRGIVALPRTLASAGGRPVRYDAWLVHARGCVVPRLADDRLELPACLAVEAGQLRGRGVGSTPNPRLAEQPWVALGVGPGLRWVPHHRVALGVELDLVIALLRGGFTVGSEVAQQHAGVGARALLGVEVRLP